MDLIALAAAKNYANKVTAGFKSVELDGMNLIFTLLDDTKATVAIPVPADGKDGVSVKDLSIDKDGSLLCHMTDGTVIDAGYVPTVDPDLTNYYTKEEIGNIEELETLNKTNVVEAVNEANSNKLHIYEVHPTALNNLLSAKDEINAAITQMSQDKYRGAILRICPTDFNEMIPQLGGLNFVLSKNNYPIGKRTQLNFFSDIHWDTTGAPIRNDNTSLNFGRIIISGSWSTGSFVCSSASYYSTFSRKLDTIPTTSSILTKTNTTAFTPTGDYHPATKKYVDDSIANIDIPETDLTNYFTKEEMKTTYLGLPIFEIPFELTEIQDWITENLIPYATENGWDSFYLKFTGLSGDPDQNYFKGLYFLESFHDISEEEERDYKIYYFKNISGYVHRIVDRAEYTDFATMYPAVALYLYADNSVRGFETASVSDIGTNSATALRTDIDYRTPYMPLYNGSPATKLYVDNKVAAIRTPKSHDGEGMIGWYNTAVTGENLTENYGVTPDMVRAVKAGDYISWPSRVQTRATENTICLYQMSYEVYNKDEGDYLETIDIKIGKSPDVTYTYVIVGDNVYKETF